MNKEQKYDELVKYIREYDLWVRSIDTKGVRDLSITNNAVQGAMINMLRKIQQLEKID